MNRRQAANNSESEPTCPLCRAEWLNTDNRSCIRPELDGESFSLYSGWLYSQRISVDQCGIYKVLRKAWTLGRIVKDTKYLNAIINVSLEFMSDTNCFPSDESILDLYINTTPDCIIRKVVVDVYIRRGRVSWFGKGASTRYPLEFFKDIAIATLEAGGGGPQPLDIAALKARYNVT